MSTTTAAQKLYPSKSITEIETMQKELEYSRTETPIVGTPFKIQHINFWRELIWTD